MYYEDSFEDWVYLVLIMNAYEAYCLNWPDNGQISIFFLLVSL